jgi:hypothetical protein
MALTYRQTKGSALTIQELDANFAFFTGSQSISGSTVISGSLTVDGPLYVTGSSVIFDTDNGASRDNSIDYYDPSTGNAVKLNSSRFDSF